MRERQVNQAAAGSPVTSIIGALTDPQCPRIVTTGLKEEVVSAVGRAAVPAHSAELLTALEERAVAEVTAAAALPITPAEIMSDRWALEDAERLGTERAACAAALKEAEAQVLARQSAHAELPLSWSTGTRVVVYGAMLASGVLTAVALSFLLAPSVEQYLCRDYLLRVVGEGQEAWSAGAALLLSSAVSLVLLVPQVLAILITAGRLSSAAKTLFIVADVLFSLMLTLVRSDDSWSWQSLSVSGLEFSLLVAQSALLLSSSPWLAKNAERAEVSERSKTGLKFAEQTRADAESALARIEHQRSVHLRTLELRFDAVRRVPSHQELVRTSVVAEYLTATAELVAQENQHARSQDEALDRLVDEHLHTELRESTGTLSPRRTA